MSRTTQQGASLALPLQPVPGQPALSVSRWDGSLLGTGLRALMRPLQPRTRFQLAMMGARVSAPLLRRLWFYPGWKIFGVETAEELALLRLLNGLHRSRLEFDPRVRVEGESHLREAIARRRGVLLIGPHTMLSTLMVRRLYESGDEVAVVAQRADWPILGTAHAVPTIQPSARTLMAVRTALAQGRVVCAMPDKKPGRSTTRTRSVEAGGRVFHYDVGLFEVALRAQAPVLFTLARVDGNHVVCVVHRPGGPGSETLERFESFVAQRLLEAADR